MRYLGGKSRLAKHIAPIIESHRAPGQAYLEPFVGGGSILCAVGGERVACDLNQALITMWTALRDGWDPPEVLDEEEYKWIKMMRDPADPLTAFAGFGCSFAAKWFGGYARGADFAGQARRVLLKQREKMKGITFHHCSYLDLRPTGLVVYCDPPYADTTSYDATGDFDSGLFWDTMFEWAKDNTVLVSEFSAPDDPRIKEVWTLERKITVTIDNYGTKVDRLYRVHP